MKFSFQHKSKLTFSFLLTVLLILSCQIYECGSEISFLIQIRK